MSTLFCTTAKLNFSAQVCGKFSKVFTACRVVFCLLWCCAPFAQTCRANNAHNFNEISKCLPSFVLRQNSTFLHRFAANLARCLQACRVIKAIMNILKCQPPFVLCHNFNLYAWVSSKVSIISRSLWSVIWMPCTLCATFYRQFCT